jgi:hypothetical protein
MENGVAHGELLELEKPILGGKGRERAEEAIVPRGGEAAVAVDERKEVSRRLQHVEGVAARGGDLLPRVRDREGRDRPWIRLREGPMHRRDRRFIAGRIQGKGRELDEQEEQQHGARAGAQALRADPGEDGDGEHGEHGEPGGHP